MGDDAAGVTTAMATAAVGDGELDTVDAVGAEAAALGPQLHLIGLLARGGIRGGVAVSEAVQGLVLEDTGDLDVLRSHLCRAA
jgi:hypothetical protein